MTDIKNHFRDLLSVGDLRSIGNSDRIVTQVHNIEDFDALFDLFFEPDRPLAMHAADAIEKITRKKPEYLSSHCVQIVELCKTALHKELKWHLALLLPRLALNNEEVEQACQILTTWALDKTNSRIVRVNSLQGLYELSNSYEGAINNSVIVRDKLEKENIPSIAARIRALKNRSSK